MQPIIVIVLVEAVVILALALGAALYLHTRTNRRHRVELKAVMDIARHAEHAPAPVDVDFIARTQQDIGEIRDAMARLDAKFGETHHADRQHDHDVDHQIAQEHSQIQEVRQGLHNLSTAVLDLKAQLSTLEQDLHTLRGEIERRPQPSPAVNAQPQEPSATNTVKTAPTPDTLIAAATSKPEVSRHETASGDEFTLPDSVLEQLEEVAKLAAETPFAPTPATRRVPAVVKTAEAAPRVLMIPGATATAVAVAATAVKHETVDEPQYAFDPTTIDDLFNVPLFIPGAANEGIDVEELNLDDLNIEQTQDAPHPTHEHPQYDADRVFYQSAEQSGIKTGWYFTLRGGKTHGPFGSHEAGTRVLKEMIEQFKRTGDSGGR